MYSRPSRFTTFNQRNCLISFFTSRSVMIWSQKSHKDNTWDRHRCEVNPRYLTAWRASREFGRDGVYPSRYQSAWKGKTVIIETPVRWWRSDIPWDSGPESPASRLDDLISSKGHEWNESIAAHTRNETDGGPSGHQFWVIVETSHSHDIRHPR